uniref:Uncharacterized protein n=1 Tax=Sus scrofa TaxID=9823 RepID=A0A480ECQ2_PIG
MVWIYHILYIHSSVDMMYLGCFYFLAMMNNTAMNILVQVSAWTYVFSSLKYIPRSGILGSYGNSVFYLVKNCQTVFQKWLYHFTSSPAVFQFLRKLTNIRNCHYFLFYPF